VKELAERDASGAIAVIYDEIRRFCAIPYVSSMQRHLATRPGWLEWVWAALRPAFVSGRAQTAAWRAADTLRVPRLVPLSRDTLRVWGVDAAGEAAIRDVCDSFIRASPTNLMLSGMLRRLLAGERPAPGRVAHAVRMQPSESSPTGTVDTASRRGRAGERNAVARGDTRGAGAWTPPPSVAALPPLVDMNALPPAERGVLLTLSTPVEGQPFVPGLYRMLAQWPAFLAHLATVLAPHFENPETIEACGRLLDAIDAEVPSVFAALPPLPTTPPVPPADEFASVRAALDAYRVTSPQMVVFSRLIRDALPA
jgi:hypothetical protein